MTPEKGNRFDAWEAELRQRFGTLQLHGGNGASPDGIWPGPVAEPRPARRRSAVVSALGMVAALLLGLVLGATLWRDHAGATSIRVVTRTSIAATPPCQESADRLERRLALAAGAARDPTGRTPPSAATADESAVSDELLGAYHNMVRQCGLK